MSRYSRLNALNMSKPRVPLSNASLFIIPIIASIFEPQAVSMSYPTRCLNATVPNPSSTALPTPASDTLHFRARSVRTGKCRQSESELKIPSTLSASEEGRLSSSRSQRHA